MGFWSILAGMLPLIIFVIADTFLGLRKGILLAVLAALFELGLSLALLGTLDFFTMVSLLLVLVMGIVSWKMKSATFFKMQPVVMGAVLSLALIISSIIDRPLLTLMMVKYKDVFPVQMQVLLSHTRIIKWLDLATLYCGIGIFVQTMLMAWAAMRLNNWWWLIFRGMGFYLFIFLGGFLAHIHLLP